MHLSPVSYEEFTFFGYISFKFRKHALKKNLQRSKTIKYFASLLQQ